MPIHNNSNCDVSTIFSGGGPGDVGAYVQVGPQQLIPSPFVSLTVEKYKMGDFTIGGVLKLTLNGTVVGNSFNDVIESTTPTRTGLNNILALAELKECVYVNIKCEKTLINGYGKILSVSSNEGNQPTWVNVAPYTIEIELYTNDITGLSTDRIVDPDDLLPNNKPFLNNLMLKNISENFSYSINEDTFNWGNIKCSSPAGISGFGNRHIKLNFSISAAGIAYCPEATGVYQNYSYGLNAAEKYLKERLTNLNFKNLSLLNSPPTDEIVTATNDYTGGSRYIDFRNISINPIENSIEVTGEMIFRPTGCEPDVFTTLNIEQQLNGEGETITLSGNIIGLVSNNFTDIIKLSSTDWKDCNYKQKISRAESFLSKLNDATIEAIANCYKDPTGYLQDNCVYSASYDDCSTSVTPTPLPPPDLCPLRITNRTITRNLSAGEISFTFTLSNSANCDIIGARKVTVEVTHDKPHDNIVEILIPGRGSKGVLIQNLCCNSAEKYDVTVDATLNRKVCQANIKQQTIQELRQCAEKALKDLMDDNPDIDFSCWFKTNDQETIGNSSYRLSQSYVKPSCP